MLSKLKIVFYFLVIVIFGKVSGLIKDILITYYYGVSTTTDAYFIATSISALLYIAIYSAIPMMVVPFSMQKDKTQLKFIYLIFVVLSLILSLLSFIFAEKLIILCAKYSNIETQTEAAFYLKIMSVGYLFSTLVAFYNAIQSAKGITLFSYLVPIVNNVFFCSGLILFPASLNWALWMGGLAWVVQAYFNKGYSKVKLDFTRNNLTLYERENVSTLLKVFSLLLFFLIEQATNFINIFFASNLGGGAVSIFSFSVKVNSLVITLVTLYFTTIIFPKFATLFKNREPSQISSEVRRYMFIILALTVPLCLLAFLFREQIIGLIYKRGQFTKSDVLDVAEVFGVFMFTLPFLILKDFFNKVYVSTGNTFKPMLISLGNLALSAGLSLVLSKKYGLLGLGYSSIISNCISCYLIYLQTHNKIVMTKTTLQYNAGKNSTTVL